MAKLPRDRLPDATMALLADPYGFISSRCRRLGSDAFQTRILMRKTICLTGRAGAQLFYDPTRFVRRGAAPGRVEKTLFGRGGVQGLDEAAHRQRKQMFLSMMSADRIADLTTRTDEQWHLFAGRWSARAEIVLYDELQELLTRAACAWAGVPLAEAQVAARTSELAAMFDAAGSVGPRHWKARASRKRAEAWLATLVGAVRDGSYKPADESALATVAWHRDADGKLLEPRIAAVELLNVLRPTVAVSVFIVFAALALHQWPQYRERLLASRPARDMFVLEVRRFFPFFPAVAARVREDFEWEGYRFPGGCRALLDLYGTDHDPRSWDAPDEFRPERFRFGNNDPFRFVPQGGGSHEGGHRCPGEWITNALVDVSLRFLAGTLHYEVPPQDLSLQMRRLPALPASRFVMSGVRLHDVAPPMRERLRAAR